MPNLICNNEDIVSLNFIFLPPLCQSLKIDKVGEGNGRKQL